MHEALPGLGEVMEGGDLRLEARAQEVVAGLGALTGEDLIE